jgi:TRAP-type transport system periplasmic protein
MHCAALAAGLLLLVAATPEEGGPGCIAEKPPVTIRLATAFAPGHILTDTGQRFKLLIEERTRGRITVDLRAAAGTEDEVNAQTAAGTVDMQATGGPPIQFFAPQYFFFNGPYVIRDYAHFLRVWNGELGRQAKALIADSGHMLSLGTVYRGFRQLTSRQAVTGPADLVGLRLRLPNVPTWTAVWTSLETVPVTVALPELYEALRTGLADASEGDLSQISSLKLPEVQTHLSLTSHLVGVGWIFVNRPFFERLSRRDRHEITAAMAEATEWATARTIAGEGAQLDDLRAAGMTVGTPDAAAIRAKARPAVEELFRTAWPVTTWDEVLAQ